MKVPKRKNSSWRKYPIEQQPEWPDRAKLNAVITQLNKLPSLVFSGETRKLINNLSQIDKGKSFVLQVGNCAETFDDCNGPKIHNFLRILLQMSIVLSYETNKDIIKIGRVAGQYAKPRTNSYEIINGVKLPSYRGDMINSYEPTITARTPNPKRMLKGYYSSASTLNLIRAFTQGGYNDIDNLLDWKEHFFSKEISNFQKYKDFERNLTSRLSKDNVEADNFKNDIVYTSHESLILEYEDAFSRTDTTNGLYYDTSAHMLWIGDRTRKLDSAHVEFASKIGNPIGLKVGPNCNIEELISIINKLNPSNKDGKIIIIIRFGEEYIESELPKVIQAVQKHKLSVIWCSDPMHGNTFKYKTYKVRSFENIISEIDKFFKICGTENVIPGGVHLEITGEYVTECVGGMNGSGLSNLPDKYVTKVDPRLNAAQALEIAFHISSLLKN